MRETEIYSWKVLTLYMTMNNMMWMQTMMSQLWPSHTLEPIGANVDAWYIEIIFKIYSSSLNKGRKMEGEEWRTNNKEKTDIKVVPLNPTTLVIT